MNIGDWFSGSQRQARVYSGLGSRSLRLSILQPLDGLFISASMQFVTFWRCFEFWTPCTLGHGLQVGNVSPPSPHGDGSTPNLNSTELTPPSYWTYSRPDRIAFGHLWRICMGEQHVAMSFVDWRWKIMLFSFCSIRTISMYVCLSVTSKYMHTCIPCGATQKILFRDQLSAPFWKTSGVAS